MSTAVRDSLRQLAWNIRAIPGRDFGIRPYTLHVRVTTYAGDHVGDGTETATTTPITEADGQPPKVRFLNDEQRALGGLPDGTVEVGPITPSHPGGGTDLAILTPSTEGTVVHYILTGPEHPTGASYLLHAVKTDRALRYMLTLKPVAEK